MPIQINEPVRELSQSEFGEISFEVMELAFSIHNRMGRFFDETIYQQEIANLLGSRAKTEVPVHVLYEDFRKTFRLDLLVDGGALFELKNRAATA